MFSMVLIEIKISKYLFTILNGDGIINYIIERVVHMKREFNKGDIAYLTKGKRFRGFNLKNQTPVKIVGYKKIDLKHGAYGYDVEVTNPKTGKTEIYEQWLNQFDFMTKSMAEEYFRLKAEIEERRRIIAEREIENAKE